MIERVIEFSVHNRTLVIVAGLALALWGVYAVYHTPVDAIPDLSENQVIVFTDWPGHSPHEVEDQVTYPLSLHLQGLAGVRVVRSSSDVNFSMISIIFEDVVNAAAARRRVAERLAGAAPALPEGVVPALAPDAAATGQIFWYTVEGPGYDLGRLRAVQDWYVRPQFASVVGVAEVASVGGRPAEYQIEIDPLRLRARGVALGDVLTAVGRANTAVGGHVVEKANAEYIVRSAGQLGQTNSPTGEEFSSAQVVRDLENVVVPAEGGRSIRLADVANVTLGSGYRRGVLEKDGNEVTGGVVLLRNGENPLEVTRRLRQKVAELQPGLPPHVRIVPFYDRTPLIEGAVRTVTGTLTEAIITAAVCVLLVLLHVRTSFVIALTLPLATLGSFAIMDALRRLGIADIQTNVMSLAGIAISIGVLVDAAIVMAENVLHVLKDHHGDRPVRGDTRPLVLAACRMVGRPIFFSVLIMLLSFLPVFALGGMEGKMFRPLAFTKSFALITAAVLAITLVPALCTLFIRGKLRGEMDSPLVRGVIEVYRPVLTYLLDRPAPLVWFLGLTFVVGLAPVGNHWLFLGTLFVALVASLGTARTWPGRAVALVSLVLAGLVADEFIHPLGREFITPLDEGMVMDMPITIPRASVTQSGDDLKARDMVLCRFPEVDMVVGKAGRAETPTDPAPLDMIETMVNFRPVEFWPRRKLRTEDAITQAALVLKTLQARGLVGPDGDPAAQNALVNEAVMEVLPLFDVQMREYAYQRNQELTRGLGKDLLRTAVGQMVAMLRDNGTLHEELTPADITSLAEALPREIGDHLAAEASLEDVTALAQATAARLMQLGWVDAGPASSAGDIFRYRPYLLTRALIGLHTTLGGTPPTFFGQLQEAVAAHSRDLWQAHVRQLDEELVERASGVFTRLILEELLTRAPAADRELAGAARALKRFRAQPPAPAPEQPTDVRESGGHHHAGSAPPPASVADLPPLLYALQNELTGQFASRLLLWRKERADLIGFGGELDRAMQMPGWTNVWTMPIQNRVDMLSTGVNTTVGVRVLGRRLDDVVRASGAVAAALKRVPGAADVIADPVRGKGYLEVRVDRAKAAQQAVLVGDVNDLVETALGGRVVTTIAAGRERYPVRIRYARAWREGEEAAANLLVPVRGMHTMEVQGSKEQLQQSSILHPPRSTLHSSVVPLSEVAEVRIVEGPATIKSENCLLRNYVRLNVRGRDAADFVEEARQTVAAQVPLPPGVHLEWAGQFEHEVHARDTLSLIVPVVLWLIFLVLYLTYHDFADAVLMLLAVPGAIAGGVFFQWLFGFKFSVTVWVGYIACFGMATATGIIMLVYLREAVARAGGLEKLTLDQLRRAVLGGAVHRLRPKLLTEATVVIGLAPLLWATGPGAEVIRPMAAPVLGGILIADEVIDLLLPVLFYHVRRRRLQRHQAIASDAAPRAVAG
jgi:Cu(I)/Ag(I) efflux system membrane protein CusA/SilA